MKTFFMYNWHVRDEWFDWCEQLTEKELKDDRIGGVNSFLYTMFHIAEVEYSWIRAIKGKGDVIFNYGDYDTLSKVRLFSEMCRKEVRHFLESIDAKDLEKRMVKAEWDSEVYFATDILHHIIAHEIHHIGQLSVWARQLGVEPVGAHFIGRDFR
ncbi:MAG: DinB family protein [Bacillus sp. (in: firmicutes)]